MELSMNLEYLHRLMSYIPASFIQQQSSSISPLELVRTAVNYSLENRQQDGFDELFKELGIDRQAILASKASQSSYSLEQALDKSLQEQGKRLRQLVANYSSANKENISSKRWSAPKTGDQRDNFKWLQLKGNYPLLKNKLKAKIIQSVLEEKNERNIRSYLAQAKAQPNVEHEKINLQDESLILEEYQSNSIDYTWAPEDEALLLANIRDIKSKLLTTDFLKLCGRFKFISRGELETLAAEEISRRLDRDNKVFLSRQFLLDKYYSTTETLSQQEMRFILKTSPMLNRYVNRDFIKEALTSIRYEDIGRLELKIAEEIISRFEHIRVAVRQSRKIHQQQKNTVAMQRIQKFEEKKNLQLIRKIVSDELQKHKTAFLRRFSFNNGSLKVTRPQSSTAYRGKEIKKLTAGKSAWPKPLNKLHPASGLFVRDCNQQCNDDLFNSYELKYMNDLPGMKAQPALPKQLISFYSGGPQTANCESNELVQDVHIICEVIKSKFIGRLLTDALANIPLPETDRNDDQTGRESLKTASELETKKVPFQDPELLARRRLIENNEKTKANILVQKLLLFAAENNLLAVKSLGSKFTVQEVNSRDKKGNTALYYAAKHGNLQLVNHLMNFSADPNLPSEHGETPLHCAFRSSDLMLISRALLGPMPPNLNALNEDLKTPLAYCSRRILLCLGLENGIAQASSRDSRFDNNALLKREVISEYDQTKTFSTLDQTLPKTMTEDMTWK